MREREVVRTLEHLQQCPHYAFPHAPAERLFEQQFRAQLRTTVRRMNKADPPVYQSWTNSVHVARQCFFII